MATSKHTPRADFREMPVYGIAEAARYLHLVPATLRTWVFGRKYASAGGEQFSPPIIHLPDSDDRRLSFSNLVEAHVLRALRTDHGLSMQAVRRALDYAEREFKIDRLLLREEILTAPGDLFLDQYGQLISLSRSGQLAIRKLLEGHLKRINRDVEGLPIRLYPVLPNQGIDGSRTIVIDPRLSYGRPVLESRGISTSVLTDRLDAGESVDDLAADYDLEKAEVEEAILYERAA